eukprot:scaffold9773_cov151-Skeletonema_marinoi.AAC.7
MPERSSLDTKEMQRKKNKATEDDRERDASRVREILLTWKLDGLVAGSDLVGKDSSGEVGWEVGGENEGVRIGDHTKRK